MPPSKKRTALTPVACDLCRKRKKKCDGAKPICRPCRQQNIDTPCQYDELHRIGPLLDKIAALQAALSEARGQLPSNNNTSSAQALDTRTATQINTIAWSDEADSTIDNGCLSEDDAPTTLANPSGNSTPATFTEWPENSPSAAAAPPLRTQKHYHSDWHRGQNERFRSTNNHPDSENSISSVDAFGGLGMSSAIRCNWQSPSIQGVQLSNFELPAHVSSTLWLEPSQVPGNNIEWVNKAFWDMRTRGRWLVQQGVDASAIMGDTCPTLSSSSPSPEKEGGAEFWTVSRWATRFVDSFLHLSLADRLACWIVMFVIFQWQICPNAETYRTIPEWYRPLPVQHFVPHMACLDILIWPSARAFLAKHPQDFVVAVMSTISVSWPHGDSGLFCTDMLTGKRQISPTFVAWCLNMSNWSVSDTSIASMPQLHGKIKIRQEPDPLAM